MSCDLSLAHPALLQIRRERLSVGGGLACPLSAALLAALLYSPMSAVPLAADPLRSGRGIFELQSYSALRSRMPKATMVVGGRGPCVGRSARHHLNTSPSENRELLRHEASAQKRAQNRREGE